MGAAERGPVKPTGRWKIFRLEGVSSLDYSPVRLMAIMGCSIFLANIGAVYFLGYFPNLSEGVHALIDSIVLILTVSPMFYYFWLRPLMRHIADLRKAEGEIRSLSQRLIVAGEEERRNLAHELHDECGQAITALQFGIESLHHPLSGDEARCRERFNNLAEMTSQLGEHIRNFSASLRPPMLDEFGIVPTLKWYVDGFSRRRADLKIDFRAIGLKQRLPPEMEIVLYRICQEALTNIARHARASQVGIMLTCSHPMIILTIKDNGVGFEGAESAEDRLSGKTGLGLLGIRERAASLGGTVEIQSAKGSGTVIRARLPL